MMGARVTDTPRPETLSVRVFFTIVLGLVFQLAFLAFFVLNSVVGLPTDSEAVVGALRDGDLHGAMVDLVDDRVRRQVRTRSPDPDYADHVTKQIRPLVEEAVPERWFYETLEKAHEGLVRYVEKGKDNTSIDLTDLKSKLKMLLLQLGSEVVAQCEAEGASSRVCTRVGELNSTYKTYRAQVETAVESLPDETNLTALIIAGSGGQQADTEKRMASQRKKLGDARDRLAKLDTVRWAAVGVLAFLLLLVALINKRTVSRMLVNVGLVLSISCVFYLVSVEAAGRLFEKDLLALVQEDSPRKGGDRADKVVANTAKRVVISAYQRTYRRSNGAVFFVLVLGVGVLAGGVEITELRSRRAT